MTDAGPSHHTLSRRLSFIYSTAAIGLAVLCLFWLAVLLVMQWWTFACIEAVLVLACLSTWLLIRRGRLSTALIVTQLMFYVVILTISLVYDLPNAAAPRVTHLFLLAIALLGYINYIREPVGLQLLVIAVALISFVVFASSEIALPFATPLPDAVRVPGSWINTIVATAILCGCVYAMQTEFSRKSTAIRELQGAAYANQLVLFYQRQVDGAGTMTGAEALLRWRHPKRGLVPPVEFIPVAEQNGLMTLIGGWVLEQACRTLAIWQQDPATSHLRLSVNVSAGQFLDADFEKFVLDVTTRHGVDNSRLKLELTESVMMANTDLVVAKMTALRDAGIGIALDDFGTGYSSLGYLKQLPLEEIKIDRSFVQDAIGNERSAALTRSVIQLGKDLHMTVVAEGVETEEQFDFLRQNGCKAFQGYLFGRPVPLDELFRPVPR